MISNPDSNIMWTGKPMLKPFLIKKAQEEGRLIFFFLGFVALTFFGSLLSRSDYGWTLVTIVFAILLIISAYKIISLVARYKKIQYVITDKLIILEDGSHEEGTTIQKKEIKFIDVSATKVEKKYQVGTVFIHSGEFIKSEEGEKKKYYKIECIPNPENIVRIL
jgi:membrane protein YdbS with pleckstrin-like domain